MPHLGSVLGPMYARYDVLRRKIETFRARHDISTRLMKRMRNNFKIGFAVLVHERPDHLRVCLDSLFRTNLHDYDITFLIQDDGSKDSRVKEIIETSRDSKYKIVRSYTEKGHNSWGAAFNKAMKKLMEIDDFDILGSCDADAFFHPEWLDKTLKVCLWAKEHHRDHVLGPFSSFNSSDREFHRILGAYESPDGAYIVKERMGALNYLYFKEDLLKLGYFEENRDDETLMTEKFRRLKVRNFCTRTSYVEHLGEESVLDQWRPTAVGGNAAYALKPARYGWVFPKHSAVRIPVERLQNSLVLQIRYGGLGDHLFHSHVPRIAKQYGGYERVYISEFSEFRSSETRHLVWELNPFIDGFVPLRGDVAEVGEPREDVNFLDEVMLYYDIDDGRRNHEPELFYRPTVRPELAGRTLYDPNFISNAGKLSSQQIETFFRRHNVKVDFQMTLQHTSLPIGQFGAWLKAGSLKEFCDILYSAGKIYCLTTGTATLCAALGKKATVLYGKGVMTRFHHSIQNEYHYIGRRLRSFG